MRYFFDTEFIEDGSSIELISIGIVSEDGRELYLENCSFSESLANAWVREHVLPLLGPDNPIVPDGCYEWNHPVKLARIIAEFCDPAVYGKPEFWTYYGDYDWVALCQLFGTMMDLPKGWPMLAYDLRQWLDHKGLTDLRQPDDAPHHALADARWVAETLKKHS